MKIPKAKKLPSGSWFCRVRVGGKDIGITRPTEKEAVAEAMAVKAGAKAAPTEKKTLAQAIDDYIAARENILSPATILGYRRIQKNRFPDVMGQDIHKMTPEKWQRAVNAAARKYSGKTLKNSWGFIASVIREETGQQITVQLPQVLPNEKGFLRAEEIPALLRALAGSDIEIAALLALSSMRQSEILGLKWDSVDLAQNVIHVEEVAVKGESGWVRKEEAKNLPSRRMIPIIEPLRIALEKVPNKEGYIVTMSDNTIRRKLRKMSEEADIPYVGLHGLRHSFASLAYHLGLSEEATMKIGGWSDIQTMRKIYTHISESDINAQSEVLLQFFQNGNENGNEDPQSPV